MYVHAASDAVVMRLVEALLVGAKGIVAAEDVCTVCGAGFQTSMRTTQIISRRYGKLTGSC